MFNAVGYNAERKLNGWLWSDGKARTISYDANGLISGYSLGDPQGSGNAAGVMRTLTRDAGGRISGYSHTNTATGAAWPASATPRAPPATCTTACSSG